MVDAEPVLAVVQRATMRHSWVEEAGVWLVVVDAGSTMEQLWMMMAGRRQACVVSDGRWDRRRRRGSPQRSAREVTPSLEAWRGVAG